MVLSGMAIDAGPVLFCLSTVPERFQNGSGSVLERRRFWNGSRNGFRTVPERFQNGFRTVPQQFRNSSGTDPEQNNIGGHPPQLPCMTSPWVKLVCGRVSWIPVYELILRSSSLRVSWVGSGVCWISIQGVRGDVGLRAHIFVELKSDHKA